MEILMSANRILVIQTAFLGDAILTLPLIQKIKERYPESLMDVICIPAAKDVFTHSPVVNNVIVYDKRNKHKSLSDFLILAKQLHKQKYSMIYSPHRSARTTLLVKLSGAKETYGFDKSALSFLYKNRIKYRNDFHEVHRNLSLMKDETIDDWKIAPLLEIPKKIKKSVTDKIGDNIITNMVAIAPGSVWATKVYPKIYFIDIIKYLVKKSCQVVLLGGEKDKEVCNDLTDNFDEKVFSMAGKLSVIESIELLTRCELLVSNDSAPTHMAMCAPVKVLTIYCSTVPSFGFYPYLDNSDWISYDKLECKPCGIHGHMKCPTGTFDCAIKLKPEYVIEKIDKLLSGKMGETDLLS